MEPRDGQRRYLIHFADGGTGMRVRDRPIEVGDRFDDGGDRYVVVRVEQPATSTRAGRAWAEPVAS